MAMSELLKEALLIQENVQFVGFGKLPIESRVDASVARQFVHRKGAGRMKHIDTRLMWLQQAQEEGKFGVKKIPREINISDMLTHAPSALELKKFLPEMGIYPLECSDGAYEMVKSVLAKNPLIEQKVAAAILECSRMKK